MHALVGMRIRAAVCRTPTAACSVTAAEIQWSVRAPGKRQAGC
jgi:hypothetical protein